MKKFATLALAGAISIAAIAATIGNADAHGPWHHGYRGFGGSGFGGFGLGLGLGMLASPYFGYGPGFYGPSYYDPYYAPAQPCWRWSHRWHRSVWVCG
jgi:hypothetical protein